MTDELILDLFFSRDERAIEQTGIRFGAYCRKIADGILRCAEDAEEVVNDAFLAAWNSIPPNRPRDLKMYLGKLTRNRSLDRYRAMNAEKRGSGETAVLLDELAECIPGGDSPELEMEGKALSEGIDAFLRTCPKEERQIFLLRYFYAESADSIGKRFGLNRNAVNVRLHRTREKLRNWLQQEGLL